jgi:hypothetical protein
MIKANETEIEALRWRLRSVIGAGSVEDPSKAKLTAQAFIGRWGELGWGNDELMAELKRLPAVNNVMETVFGENNIVQKYANEVLNAIRDALNLKVNAGGGE